VIKPAIKVNGESRFHGLSADDWEQVQKWNSSCPEVIDACIHDLIHRRAELQPDAVAICSWDGRLTYLELDTVTSQLALWLTLEGVGPDTRVPICFEKSKWAVITMISVLKAGGSFVPLDATQPVARLNTMIQELGSGLITTSASGAVTLTGRTHARVVVINQELLDSLPLYASRMETVVSPDQTAFIMFTVRVSLLGFWESRTENM
jgi:non-ribosomal peptide synthetase component F